MVIGGFILSVAYFALPSGWPQSIWYEAIGAAAAAAVAIGIVTYRPRWWPAWTLIGLGQVLFVLADLAFAFYEQLTGEIPIPSIADALYIGGYLVLAAGVLWLIRGRGQEPDRSASIDALIVAAALGLVTWLAFIEPLAIDAELTLVERLVYASYPAMDILIIGITARLLAGGGRFPADWLLVTSLLFTLAGDVGYALPPIAAEYASGHPIDLLWLLGYVFLGAAALHPSMAASPQATSERPISLTRVRLAVLTASLLLGPALLLAHAVGMFVVDPGLIGLISAAITVLVVIRLADLTRALGRSEARFGALIQNATDAFAILDADGVHTYVSPAVSRVLGVIPAQLVSGELIARVHPDDRTWVADALTGIRSAPGSERSGTVRLRRSDGSWAIVEMVVKNLVDDPAVAGIVLNYRDVSERSRLESELRHQAFHDQLTGLPNRALFLDRLEVALTGRDVRPVVVLFLDLDDFKAVNDALGHAAGDELLVEIAGRLRTAIRAEDTAARVGGDEFAILLGGNADRAIAEATAKRILRVLDEPLSLDGRQIAQRSSVGVAMSDAGAERPSPDEVLRDADLAMYKAKLAGKGRIVFFEPGMREDAVARLELRSALEGALERGEMRLHLQPIVSLGSRIPIGLEALLRWDHPQKGLLAPGAFLSIAEESGLIVPIGRWILAEATRLAATQLRDMPIAVNVSVRELSDPRLVQVVSSALAESGLPAERLTIEIPESLLLEDADERLEDLLRLKRLGLRLAIDDFGTGYSSLGYLRRLPLDQLKLDRSFVEHVSQPHERTVARAIIELARSLELDIVAEGIETEEQRAALLALGCHSGQGYLFSEPMPTDAAAEWLDRQTVRRDGRSERAG